ncbi:MAG: hypothetical protein HC820_06835 [Hydrococcus sp. RM1_1_31]|nr:hypothetical protein [Hydrococcus sp. RM1_1_31]
MNSENIDPRLKIDFDRDWKSILSQKLVDSGYSADTDRDTFQICIQYFNCLKRQIESKPRKVFISKELKCPDNHKKGLDIIREKVTRGQDLTPHLSKLVKRNLNFNDSLLNDWGIYHFHLGDLLLTDGFMTRTGSLLFARITHDCFYMIDIFNHGDWCEKRIVETLHNNWKESIELYTIKGVKMPSAWISTNNVVPYSRKHGISTFIQVSDGTIYCPAWWRLYNFQDFTRCSNYMQLLR